MKVIPACYDVSSELWNEHDGDSPGLLAALSESVVDIQQDSTGLMATLASQPPPPPASPPPVVRRATTAPPLAARRATTEPPPAVLSPPPRW